MNTYVTCLVELSLVDSVTNLVKLVLGNSWEPRLGRCLRSCTLTSGLLPCCPIFGLPNGSGRLRQDQKPSGVSKCNWKMPAACHKDFISR